MSARAPLQRRKVSTDRVFRKEEGEHHAHQQEPARPCRIRRHGTADICSSRRTQDRHGRIAHRRLCALCGGRGRALRSRAAERQGCRSQGEAARGGFTFRSAAVRHPRTEIPRRGRSGRHRHSLPGFADSDRPGGGALRRRRLLGAQYPGRDAGDRSHQLLRGRGPPIRSMVQPQPKPPTRLVRAMPCCWFRPTTAPGRKSCRNGSARASSTMAAKSSAS